MIRVAAIADQALAFVAVTEASVALLLGGRRGAARRVRLAGAVEPTDMGRADHWRCTRAVSRAAALVPWRVRCLPAALALQRVLAWRGSPSRVVLGVRVDGGELVAHAWVECAGMKFDPLSPDEPYETLALPTEPTGANATTSIGGSA